MEAISGHDEDILRPGDMKRPQKSEIIGRSAVTSDCDANQGSCERNKWLDPIVEGASPSHGIGDVTGLQARQSREVAVVGTRKITPDL
jgi:hypothetical protein